MATLREMLVKIYQPRQGIIEFGPAGQSTQDGATGLAVLGGGPNQASDGGGQGGTISMPAFRYAGMEGGGGGGGGGIDWSSIDWSDPEQVQRVRDYLEREGGQAGEPGGAGEGSVGYGSPDAYVDPTLAELVGIFGPGAIGMVGSLAAAGMRGHNAGLLDDELQAAGFAGLSGLQMAGAFGNFNSYGAGDPRDTFGAQGIGGLAEAAYEAQTNRGVYDSLNDPAMGVSANQRARSDTRGGQAPASAGASAEGRSAAARHAERSSYGNSGRIGGGERRDSGYHAGSSYGGGGGGGGAEGLGGTRDREGKSSADRHGAGNYHDGGMVHGMPGEEVDGTLLAGEYVMGPEAVEMFGPQTFEKINNLARMMRQQHYPAR